jgi:hypothetical protein
MSCSDAEKSKVQRSLEQIFNELNRLGYDLIDYTNSFSEVYDTDIWHGCDYKQVKKESSDEPIQKIIDGFKELGGTSIDLLSPYGDLDFEAETKSNEEDDIIERYLILAGKGRKEASPSRTPEELIARYKKLNRG